MCLWVVFLSQKTKIHEVLLKLVKKTKQVYVLPKLVDSISLTTSFDLWMSKGAHAIFTFVILTFKNLINNLIKWLLGCLKQQKLLVKPWSLIWKNCLINMDWEKNYFICEREMVKFECNDSYYSKLIVKCQVLGLNENFQGICFGHVFSKASQYPTTNE